MKLSKHFSVMEFERSATAKKYGINNEMPPKAIAAAIRLCSNVLEEVRAHFGMPIYISSGYRCPAVNSHSSVKGARKSQHMKGEAADIYIKNTEMPLRAVAVWMRDHLDYDQLIWETRITGAKWIHVSYKNKEENRHQALKTKDGYNYKVF